MGAHDDYGWLSVLVLAVTLLAYLWMGHLIRKYPKGEIPLNKEQEMSKPYYTLLERNDNKWSPQFGDYVRKVVQDEMDDLYYRYRCGMIGAPRNVTRRPKLYLYKIIRTEADDQATIDVAIAVENLALEVEANH